MDIPTQDYFSIITEKGKVDTSQSSQTSQKLTIFKVNTNKTKGTGRDKYDIQTDKHTKDYGGMIYWFTRDDVLTFYELYLIYNQQQLQKMANCHSTPFKQNSQTRSSSQRRATSLKARMLNMKLRRQLSISSKKNVQKAQNRLGMSNTDLLLMYISSQFEYKMYEHEFYPNIALYYQYASKQKTKNPEDNEKNKQSSKLNQSQSLKPKQIQNNDVKQSMNNKESKVIKATQPISLVQQIVHNQQKVDLQRQHGDSDQLRYCLGKLGELCWRNGQYNRSIMNLQQGLRVCNRLHQPQSLQSAFFYSNLGLNYQKLKLSQLAFKNFQIAFRINRNKKGQVSHGVATAYNNIGNIFKSKGRHQKALQYYYKSLKIKTKLFGQKNEGVAASLSNIALLQWQMKKYTEAVDKYKQALAIYRQIYGTCHFQISRTLYNLALCYYDMKQYTLWFQSHFQSLNILQQLKMKQHPSYNKRKSVFIQNLKEITNISSPKYQLFSKILKKCEIWLLNNKQFNIIETLKQKIK